MTSPTRINGELNDGMTEEERNAKIQEIVAAANSKEVSKENGT